ncbi:unnamed protein product [Sphagnum jensenii]|uniref:Uncharacterized protein n=1 Tax=Sphagnum jensenii TaxID=128206 RepID=A0ABP1C2U5_9BRYO
MLSVSLVSGDAVHFSFTLKPPVGNALWVVSTQGGSGSGAGERPSAGSKAGSGLDAPTLNMGRVPPRDRVSNDHSGIEGNRPVDTRSGMPDDLIERTRTWTLTENPDSSQYHSIRLPDTLPLNKVSQLIYTNAGVALLALGTNAVHKLWKWQRSDRNPTGKATASFAPQLWQPPSGILMTNDISETNVEEAVPCTALSRNDSYVISASGGKVSVFNIMTFKVMTTFMPPPPAATFLAFHPQDNNIIAIGLEDSTIQIYNVQVDEVKGMLRGHEKRITGLAFSNALHILVSSGADAQLCVWGTDGWEKQKSKFVQVQPGRVSPMGDTRVQFHNDQFRLLVVHESQLAIYDAAELERLRHWVPRDSFSASISNATYSCDSQLVYAGFVDGSVGVFDAESLQPRCRLSPSVHIPQGVSNSTVYPLVIAAHPVEPNQFALGLSDGGVQVLEPLESEGKWGVGLPSENGTPTGVPSGPTSRNQGSDQTRR